VLFYPWVLAGTDDFWDDARPRFRFGPTVPAEVTWQGERVALSVLEISPTARLDPAWPVVKRCDVCGLERRSFVRDPDEFPQQPLRPRIVAETFQDDVARIREWPTKIVVSDRFADHLRATAVPGTIELEEVELV
jgi:hypothetical protein